MTTRRTLITLAGLAIPAAAARAQSLAPPSLETSTAAPITKDQVGYQDVPYQGKLCAQCVYFIFAEASSAVPASHCKLVAGPISPAGWCQIWAPRG
jgi:hypothetical protein